MENWKEALDRGMMALSVKTETLVESSRIRSSLAAARRDMESAVNDLGFQYYNGWLSGALDEGLLVETCKRVQEIHSKVLALQNRLDRIQAGRQTAEGSAFCAACGKKLLPGCRFCDGCGAPVGR